MAEVELGIWVYSGIVEVIIILEILILLLIAINRYLD